MADQQRVELPTFSMWAQTPVYQIQTDDGLTIIFGMLQDIIVPDPTDFLFTVPVGGLYRLDLLSQQFYGVPDLWWVIARANAIIDPLLGPALGQIIRIPTKARLATEGVLQV